MASIFTPINQVKLTNVSIVRLKKGGKRFEVACYKNKVLDYRNRIIQDLDEVLQTRTIFANVSKGLVINSDDLSKCFGIKTQEEIVKEILVKGELQVGDKERAGQLESMTKDIVNIITEKCINRENNRPFSHSAIEKALSDIHFSVNLSKNSKQQALEAIKVMQQKQTLPIARALMRVKVEMGAADGKRLKTELLAMAENVEEEDWSDNGSFSISFLMNPGYLRQMTDLIANGTKGKGKLTALSTKEIDDEEVML